MRRLVLITLFLCIPMSTSVIAQEQSGAESVQDCQKRLKSHVKCFAEHARGTFAICALMIKLELQTTGSPDDGEVCVSSAKNDMFPRYKAAMKYLSKNQKGQAILKDAYASWLAGMNTLIPDIAQFKIDYESRTKSKEVEIDQLLTRLELEE